MAEKELSRGHWASSPPPPPRPPVPQPGRGKAFNPLRLALSRASPRYLPALKFYDYRVASHRERQ